MPIRYGSTTVIVALLCFFQTTGLSQIPNAGFENWTLGNPDGWGTSNIPAVLTTVSQSSNAHTGTSAVYGVVATLPPLIVQPILQSGTVGEGFPYNGRPAAFTGYYQFSPIEGDRFGINVALLIGGIENGTLVGLAARASTDTVTSYTQFSVPFVYFDPGLPDTCVVQFQIIGPNGGDFHVGSSFLLDDIAMSGTADVEQGPGAMPFTTSLEQNYPNPFNPTTTIRYRLAQASFVTLAVYNTLGQQVAQIVNEQQQPGYHETVFRGDQLASGVYFYRLQAGDFVASRKLLMMK